MKKTALIACAIAIITVIFVKSGIIDSLVFFLLAGVVPGTRYAIPSTFMLLLITSVAWLLIFNLIPFDMFRRAAASTPKKTRQARSSKRLPKQRYEQI